MIKSLLCDLSFCQCKLGFILGYISFKSEKLRKESRKGEAYRNFMQALMMMDRNIIPNVEPFECPICYGDIDIGEGVTLRECLHNFCK